MLLYVHSITPRLQYVCDFIFEQYFGISCILTTDSKHFEETSSPKLNYSTSSAHCRYTIQPSTLLFENTINEQEIVCFENDGYKAFFQTLHSNFSFDIFAATFYLLSRYEEYLPHRKDHYGRYAHQNSLAYKEDFLQQPLVNIWLNKFKISLQDSFPDLKFKNHSFTFLPTYDIDIAWSYKNKGFLRNLGGMALNPSLERIKVLQGKAKDPYDCYDFLSGLHSRYNLKPIYFFLVAANRGRYDKNTATSSIPFQALIRDHAEKYAIGMHPSWSSGEQQELLSSEKSYLQNQVGQGSTITSSRQHYLKFNLPDTFNNLIRVGIKDDYSMGYGTVNGFRASVASSFYWYDLKQDRQTDLRLHPFCFMDATSVFQSKVTAEEAFSEMLYYYSVCKKAGGNLITIFHNNILGGGEHFTEWPAMYARFLYCISE